MSCLLPSAAEEEKKKWGGMEENIERNKKMGVLGKESNRALERERGY